MDNKCGERNQTHVSVAAYGEHDIVYTTAELLNRTGMIADSHQMEMNGTKCGIKFRPDTSSNLIIFSSRFASVWRSILIRFGPCHKTSQFNPTYDMRSASNCNKQLRFLNIIEYPKQCSLPSNVQMLLCSEHRADGSCKRNKCTPLVFITFYLDDIGYNSREMPRIHVANIILSGGLPSFRCQIIDIRKKTNSQKSECYWMVFNIGYHDSSFTNVPQRCFRLHSPQLPHCCSLRWIFLGIWFFASKAPGAAAIPWQAAKKTAICNKNTFRIAHIYWRLRAFVRIIMSKFESFCLARHIKVTTKVLLTIQSLFGILFIQFLLAVLEILNWIFTHACLSPCR